ncbi:alkanesulfonate transporter subunit; ATP-binding component of ABC superfamily [Bosea sp. 62]|uniref:ABC transporter ATP-binding protein n=1 Tax=unclassified Bosea (in: a-proteobacteria) TaxID=2653178 RepID=UPI0012559019|nr:MULTISPECIES: ABC transporter ATP-binding protein [unclassified Bosea (in: a-proteobacteria)]CAD5286079.1 alkanesulfonate transporter subunit; ATP-binding component of ABC superfamily [Bosea sp. 21B]CAD5288693.1 alkanesulfonate transporter subunit; ATP-binding component of ABC superfamily [Bosea sp. 46]CAD5301354.1 alkanesulfonate transporter subunit; ATP-binding component of ABC superfamily [Bosea sp. 7B]VVT60604.1 alkanesulfonate transporter subunit; ATP-binding component of ABC superfamil
MAQDSGRLTQPPVVAVRGLTRRYGERTIIDGVDLDIGRGEFVALLGRSGSGKSTFLRALAGLDHGVPGSGRLGTPDAVSVVFQDARLLPWKTVVDNVSLGLKGQTPRERALHALAEVELTARARAWPMQLSGGEQQRAALARSLVREPELLLLDEPFGALDALTRLRMQALLLDLCARHRPAVLLVTHDVDEAIHLAQRVLVLDQGRFVVDLKVDLPSEAGPRQRRFAEVRSELLSSLGVTQEELRRVA